MTTPGHDLFAGPVAVMLAKTGDIPRSVHRGDFANELKLDGFRLVCQVSPDAGVTLFSRSGTDLSAFPGCG